MICAAITVAHNRWGAAFIADDPDAAISASIEELHNYLLPWANTADLIGTPGLVVPLPIELVNR